MRWWSEVAEAGNFDIQIASVLVDLRTTDKNNFKNSQVNSNRKIKVIEKVSVIRTKRVTEER